MTQLSYTWPQLCEAFQFGDHAMRRQLKLWTEQHDFPRPLPGAPLRWSKPAVDAWTNPDAIKISGERVTINLDDIRKNAERAYAATN